MPRKKTADYLPTLLTDERLAALLQHDISATSLYLLMVAKHSLGLPEGCTCSTNELRRWIGEACGRKPSWAQTSRALRDLCLSGVVHRAEGPGQSVRYTLSRIPDSRDPRIARSRDAVNGFEDPRNGSRKRENLSKNQRREERGCPIATSLSPVEDGHRLGPEAAADSDPGGASADGSGTGTGDDARTGSEPGDGLPGDDARRRALGDPRLSSIVDKLKPAVAAPPLEGEALERAKRAAKEGGGDGTR